MPGPASFMPIGVLSLLIWVICGWPGQAEDAEFTTFKGHGGPVMTLDVAADGRLISGSFDNSIGLWSGGEPEWLEGHDAAVTTLISVGDQIISGGDDFAVRLWGGSEPFPQRYRETIHSCGRSAFLHRNDSPDSTPNPKTSPYRAGPAVLKPHCTHEPRPLSRPSAVALNLRRGR